MKCKIIKDCSEEVSMGSSPCEEIYVFTDMDLADEFITKWNEMQQKQIEQYSFYRKSDTTENMYYGYKSWEYWLEIEETEMNINPKTVFNYD